MRAIRQWGSWDWLGAGSKNGGGGGGVIAGFKELTITVAASFHR